jgi:hypothetical protein
MRSFRTEIENPVVEKDIIELADKIEQYNNLQMRRNSEVCDWQEASMVSVNKAFK